MFDLDKLRESALKDKVPIMQESGILYCKEFIKEKGILSILEIGTAVAYWSLCMATIDDRIEITTIEYSEYRYIQAVNNVRLANKENQITCIHLDAKDYIPNKKFDLIFLDGPKAQHKNYFNQFIPFLNPNGYIIVDNMAFHGHVENRSNLSHRRGLQKMVNKIAKFQDWIINHPDYVTMEQDIADGILVIWRKYP
ncbi:MAG: O-methyltransferase [Erysipelotrichaceae bacterium]